MMISHVAVSGYRSLQTLVVPLGPLTLVTGANGSGKSNLYKALRLIVAAARGDLVAALAREGGLAAVMWAGPERTGQAMRRGEAKVEGGPRRRPVRLRLGFAAELLSYAIELGYPAEPMSAFALDPQIKGEWIWAGGPFHPRAVLSQRRTAAGPVAESTGNGLFDGGADPQQQPEVYALREQILSWRFYDGFRTDAAAPARNPGIATRATALAGDGGNLPAALQTILENGDGQGLQAAIEDAFPSCQLGVDTTMPIFRLQFHQPGLLRPLDASELSDGTLRYVLLTVALFALKLPPLLVLNEPENSLHPDLLPALARLIGKAAENTQVWVIAHAPGLITALEEIQHCHHHRLEQDLGATQLRGQTVIERAAWRWPGSGDQAVMRLS